MNQHSRNGISEVGAASGAPRIGVVTPFYNTAAYLAECIESVLAQTEADFDYLLLDNCSTDGSGEIAARYAAQDRRVRLLRNERLLPQVPNYNRAISLADPRVRYIKVVEADNRLYPDCLAKMVAMAEAHPSVGVVSAYNATEDRLRLTGLSPRTETLDGRTAWQLTFDRGLYLFGSPTTVLMRADRVRERQPFYDESLSAAEDLSAVWQLLCDAELGFVHETLTFVRTANDGILSRIRGLDAQELDRWLLVRRHAQDFLAPDEARRAIRHAERRYYRALARGALTGQGESFWHFHRESLEAEGLGLRRTALLRGLMREAASHLRHPTKLRAVLRLRGSRRQQA